MSLRSANAIAATPSCPELVVSSEDEVQHIATYILNVNVSLRRSKDSIEEVARVEKLRSECRGG